MALHILKLCVGVDTLQELADWQAARLKQMKGPRKLLSHVTRMTPKRRDEILDGGSLYWVIKGKTSPDIGEILGSSPRTVNKHLEHVFAKLGVENRTAAASVAMARIRMGGEG